MRKLLPLLVLTLAAGAAPPIFINGQPAPHGLLQHGGKSWVCVDDLKAAGIQVGPQGGANQINAVEGKTGQWLFNGIWRLKSSPSTPIEKGWGVDIEFRNGANKEVTLHQTGVQLPTLALADGTVLKADEGDWQLICFRPLLPGAAVKHQLKFYTSGQPERLIVPVDPKFGLLRDTGLRYSVPAPSFRLKL